MQQNTSHAHAHSHPSHHSRAVAGRHLLRVVCVVDVAVACQLAFMRVGDPARLGETLRYNATHFDYEESLFDVLLLGFVRAILILVFSHVVVVERAFWPIVVGLFSACYLVLKAILFDFDSGPSFWLTSAVLLFAILFTMIEGLLWATRGLKRPPTSRDSRTTANAEEDDDDVVTSLGEGHHPLLAKPSASHSPAGAMDIPGSPSSTSRTNKVSDNNNAGGIFSDDENAYLTPPEHAADAFLTSTHQEAPSKT